ncbi:MAG: hypothetical protein MJD61_15765, partial [Proteobacteria bacterium]|nr:hypothetical protein [Pseudomonadota bacterium]
TYLGCGHPRNCRYPRHAVVSKHYVWQSVYSEGDPVSFRRNFAHRYGAGLSDHSGRGWLGFQWHTVVDLDRAGEHTTKYSFDNRTRLDSGGAQRP